MAARVSRATSQLALAQRLQAKAIRATTASPLSPNDPVSKILASPPLGINAVGPARPESPSTVAISGDGGTETPPPNYREIAGGVDHEARKAHADLATMGAELAARTAELAVRDAELAKVREQLGRHIERQGELELDLALSSQVWSEGEC